MSEPTCIRCGLGASAQLPEIRMALARAWGLVATLRLGREESDRSERRSGPSESYGPNGARVGRPRKRA